MTRIGAAVVAVLGLSACSPSVPVPPDRGQGGTPACLDVPNTLAEYALPITPGAPVAVTTGERWYGAEVEAGTYTVVINGVFPFNSFYYGIFQDSSISLVSDFTEVFSSSFKESVVLGAGLVRVKVSHIVPVGEETCETYNLTLLRGEP